MGERILRFRAANAWLNTQCYYYLLARPMTRRTDAAYYSYNETI